MDRGAWRATESQNQTQLKPFSTHTHIVFFIHLLAFSWLAAAAAAAKSLSRVRLFATP